MRSAQMVVGKSFTNGRGQVRTVVSTVGAYTTYRVEKNDGRPTEPTVGEERVVHTRSLAIWAVREVERGD